MDIKKLLSSNKIIIRYAALYKEIMNYKISKIIQI